MPARISRWLVRIGWVAVTAAGVVALLAVVRPPQPTFACTASGGGIAIASSPLGPWYSSYAPPLTERWGSLMHALRPGASETFTVYVKNLDSSARRASVSLCGLVQVGGDFTPPEQRLQSTDPGDLADAVQVELSYASTARPGDPPYIVASGTLAELAKPGTVLIAPQTLASFDKRDGELGVWRVSVSVPTETGDVIQGDRACCAVIYALDRAR